MDKRSKPEAETLIKWLPTQGWELGNSGDSSTLKDRTLEELAKIAHARHAKGEEIGVVKKVEDALELDMIQLQQLWLHLGLSL